MSLCFPCREDVIISSFYEAWEHFKLLCCKECPDKRRYLSTANICLNTWLEYFGFLSPWSLLPKCHEESYMLVCVWPSLNPPLLHQAVRVSRRSEMPTSRLLKGSLPVLRDGSLLSPLSYIIISFYFSFTFPPLYLPHSLRHARPLLAAVFCSCFLCSLYACSLSFLPKPSSF